MKFLPKLFNVRQTPPSTPKVETVNKTFVMGHQSQYITSALDFQQAYGHTFLSLEACFVLYQQIMPLQDAINKIGDKLSNIDVILKTKNNQNIIDHPFLDLLAQPNLEQSQCDFLETLSKDFSICANAFIQITISKISGLPMEMFVLPPQAISGYQTQEGHIDRYTYSATGVTDTYTRTFVDGEIQYLSADGYRRLLHLKGYNPNVAYRSQWTRWGLSKMHGILFELLQYRAGATHNLALLQQGGRPSTWIKPKDRLTKANQDHLEAEINNLIQGPSNAGRILTSNDIESIEQLIVTNVDMDYSVLESKTYNKIYQTYHIPLPIITNEASTFSNYETAQSAIIKDAVLPQYKRFASFFSRFILPYYSDAPLTMSFFKFSIDALRDEAIKEAVDTQPLGIKSDNEMRQEIGMSANTNEEADEIYKSTQSAPAYNLIKP